MLFDRLVTGGIVATHPAHAVWGPTHVVKRGKTPVLTLDEARALLDSAESTTAASNTVCPLLGRVFLWPYHLRRMCARPLSPRPSL
jgi:hypothetical protein